MLNDGLAFIDDFLEVTHMSSVPVGLLILVGAPLGHSDACADLECEVNFPREKFDKEKVGLRGKILLWSLSQVNTFGRAVLLRCPCWNQDSIAQGSFVFT